MSYDTRKNSDKDLEDNKFNYKATTKKEFAVYNYIYTYSNLIIL